jgi:CRP-like cAMP-binding protein
MATITAAEKVTTLVLPLAEFERLISNADYCRCFALLLVDHLEEALAGAADLLLRASVPRVCGRLLAFQSGAPIGDKGIRLTQSELAAMCGMTRATLSRVLSLLSETGAIELKYGRINLLNRQILQDYVQGYDA